MNAFQIAKLIISVVVTLSAGLIGLPFSISAVENWYPYLNKPFFTPPSYLFEPVWSILYLLMGLSVYLIWEKGIQNKKSREALSFYAIQLILNASWSIVFFGLRNLLFALVVIVLMLYFIYKTIVSFSKISKVSSFLLYPYAVWVSFAALLNLSIWLLNRN